MSAGLELCGRTNPLLEGAVQGFLVELERRFGERRRELLARRQSVSRYDFLPETAAVRAGSWTVDEVPSCLFDRRVEITGPADAKMIINALNSGASVFMADLEDSMSPTWENVVSGQTALFEAVRRTLRYTSPEGKQYALNERTAQLFVRPRGWHLDEAHVKVDGRVMSGGLFDFGVFFFHNAKEQLARGVGPFFYLPKLESHLEARLWNDVFVFAQDAVGIPQGSIKATVLIETLPAAFEMDEILHELKHHSAGLNCGRWDYMFSFIKKQPEQLLPDRAQLTMDRGFLRAYSQKLIQTCHRRNAHAMGGMAAFIPIKGDAQANEAALAKVRADKLREVKDGHDGTWVAHPGLVPVAQAVFDEHMPGPNQRHVKREDVQVGREDLLRVPEGTRTEEGLRHNIRVGVQYLEAWLRGQGCVPLYNLMEDAATAEICRAQVWQQVHHRVLSKGALISLVAQETAQLQGARLPEAVALFTELCLAPTFAEFLTVPAYARLELTSFTSPQSATQGAVMSSTPSDLLARRFEGIRRPYSQADVERLRGSVKVEHTLARLGAQRLWELVTTRPYLQTLGALSGGQAVQMVRAGLEGLYISGWQVAADANTAGETYSDQSLYPVDSVPTLVKRINQALLRADQIDHAEGKKGKHWLVPMVADAEAGFGGPLNAYELMRHLIEAGAAGVHFEDQLASEKKCGHMGGKVLVPTSQFIRTLIAARLAADVMDVPTVLIARTDAQSAKLITSDIDERDRPWVAGKDRTAEGFYRLHGDGDAFAIARGLAYAEYADLIWCETSTPDLKQAKRFAEGIREKFPNKMLAYNCSPSFNWKKNLDDATIAKFQRELGAMGYKFQFVTLAGFHALNYSMFELARAYKEQGMTAYSALQQDEFAHEVNGYTATKHQREVGTGYFDALAEVISGGTSSTTALKESTEAHQF